MLGPRLPSQASKVRVQRGPAPARTAAPRRSRPAASTGRSASTSLRTAVLDTRRPFLLLLVIALCAVMLFARLAYWSLMENGRLAALAAEHVALNVQPPLRGRIYDAEGAPLATNVAADEVYAVPKQIKDTKRTALLLAPVLGQSVKRLEDLILGDSAYALLASNVSPQIANKVQALALPGIALNPTVQRYYPGGAEASQLLGFTNVDGQGNGGIEGYDNRLLSGSAGLRSILKDTAGNDIHISSSPDVPSRAGADIQLTVNGVVQGLVEDEVRKAVKVHRADSGTIIVMNPQTGAILGMASAPSFNPNNYAKQYAQNPELFQDPATQWDYEPGSTFKIITMAAGLDSHLITPQSAFDDTGRFVVGSTIIHNWNMSGFGWETMTQVLQHSANVGASWVAQRLGVARFYKYVKAFHFGQPTGIGLQGEEPGMLPLPGEKGWTVVNLYTNSYGQGISVTPLQMIRAVSAVANGGVLMKPQIVKRIAYDGRVIDQPPISQGRIISPQTARTLTDMLVHSAVGGEAQLALVHGYNIAAKTGTANIAQGGTYLSNATIASIVGYAPAYHPRFAVLVILRHPRDTQWGSVAAAPVMHDLFQELFMSYHIPPAAHPVYP